MKKKWFGTTLVFRLETNESFIDKADIERLKVTAHVMKKPTEEGYVTFNHSHDPSLIWVVEAVIQESRFKEPLNPGMLFSAAYKAAYDERHLEDLISFDLSTYKKVQMSFCSLLNSVGGSELVNAAEGRFGSDLEKIVAEKFLLASDKLKPIISTFSNLICYNPIYITTLTGLRSTLCILKGHTTFIFFVLLFVLVFFIYYLKVFKWNVKNHCYNAIFYCHFSFI